MSRASLRRREPRARRTGGQRSARVVDVAVASLLVAGHEEAREPAAPKFDARSIGASRPARNPLGAGPRPTPRITATPPRARVASRDRAAPGCVGPRPQRAILLPS